MHRNSDEKWRTSSIASGNHVALALARPQLPQPLSPEEIVLNYLNAWIADKPPGELADAAGEAFDVFMSS